VAEDRYRRKRIRYRVRGPFDLVQQTEAWRDFVWQAGPWRCRCIGPFGEIQVWASDRVEGIRVINHALSAGNWDDLDPAEVEWLFAEVDDPRLGKSGVCTVRLTVDGFAVRTREGRSGPPEFHAYVDSL
jgi:hypothetical protein